MEDAGQADLDTEKIKNAMQVALDTRKFEIDLYWKRANYFWLYNASAFTAYFYVISQNKIEMQNELTLLITGIGVFLSLCWLFINKASKYWQENWEKHVDLLEDAYMGPLYKRTLEYKKTWPEKLIHKKIPNYSVSKINLLLSTGIFTTWLLLWVYTIIKIAKSCCLSNIYAGIILFVTLALLVSLIFFQKANQQIGKPFNMKERTLEQG